MRIVAMSRNVPPRAPPESAFLYGINLWWWWALVTNCRVNTGGRSKARDAKRGNFFNHERADLFACEHLILWVCAGELYVSYRELEKYLIRHPHELERMEETDDPSWICPEKIECIFLNQIWKRGCLGVPGTQFRFGVGGRW